MTFYQELQLNQAGSKELLRKSETAQERHYHAMVYLAKVAITMLYCFAYVSVFSILFGNENSDVGVVVGGNAFITKSVSKGTKVSVKNQELIFHSDDETLHHGKNDESWYYII